MCSQHAEASRGPGLRELEPGKGGSGGLKGLIGCWPGGKHSQGTGVNKNYIRSELCYKHDVGSSHRCYI